ncbi:hypothetical protein Q4577_19300 [Marinovum sp. 2_MG-2023]|uniref:Uncharacterized protein n=1 Tax=Primorskyibacter sedentarius TaxID=745311 RepID=A0A4R3J2Z7_9RHOB|nr:MULTISPECIES: hypothetical protein [Roseobacteraceae]MDO6732184.1 hypothetical protein [Marinovum sp. 2_MG-2023]MDO6781501.1 hypothetical protein [Marinovum sp. 1_MG-2023]TCS58990.1 hypothetical protein EDD52_12320 [Primorskyibacter sedentarius]
MKTTHATTAEIQPKDVKRPDARLSPHDIAGIRNRGSAASAVDLAGWLRRVFRK